MSLDVTWKVLQDMDFGPIEWFVDEWIPAGGVVLVWGQESVGKTPFCWYLAQAIGSGETFFGHAATPARVSFIELDMPPRMTKARLRNMPLHDNVLLTIAPEITSPAGFEEEALRDRFAGAIAYQPQVVFVDSLRKAHPFDDKVSEVPSRVYAMYKKLFPEATLVFIHHERKSGPDEERPGGESYSGSRAWSNDCQIGFRVSVDRRKAFPLMVKCERNQMGEKDWHKRFHLENGWLLTCDDEAGKIAELARQHTGAALARAVQEALGCSQATAYRRIAEVK